MTEKVRLPKNVCDALDMVRTILPNHEIIFACSNKLFGKMDYADYAEKIDCLNDLEPNDLMQALVLGYEPEMTAEEQIKNLYFGCSKSFADDEIYRCGVRDALQIHGISYDWLEDDAE